MPSLPVYSLPVAVSWREVHGAEQLCCDRAGAGASAKVTGGEADAPIHHDELFKEILLLH